MAELVNLQHADRDLRTCIETLDKMRHALESTYSSGGVPNDQLWEMLKQMHTAVATLTNAFASVLHNNRDGRGTQPERNKPRSMMERTR
jgi:hypothetical protein